MALVAEPGALGTPVDVSSGSQTSGPAAGEAEGREAHRLQGAVAREDHQVGPGDRAAVLLLHRPEQPARLVEVAIVRPAVQRREALHAGGRAASAVVDAVRPGAVPHHPDHERPVVAEVGRPPLLRGRQHLVDVPGQGVEVEGPELRGVVEVRAHGVGRGGCASRRIVRSSWFGHQSRLRRALRPGGRRRAAGAGRPRPPPLPSFTSPATASGLSDTGNPPGLCGAQMSSARRTAGAFRRETGTISFVRSSMTRDSSPLRPRSISRTRLRLTTYRRCTRRKPASASSPSSLSRLWRGGAQPSLVGGQPHVVPLRLGEGDLRQPQQHHPVVAHRDQSARLRPRVRGPLRPGAAAPRRRRRTRPGSRSGDRRRRRVGC